MAHDPRPFVSMLRDHLAAHDKRIAFLFGAGTSCAVTVATGTQEDGDLEPQPLIPAMDALTTLCSEAMGLKDQEYVSAWGNLATECSQLNVPTHIEGLLGRLRRKLDGLGPNETMFGLTKSQAEEIEELIRTTICSAVSPDEDAIPRDLPHDRFARWVRHARRTHAVEIFTTNYDVLLERSLERARVPLFDGFIGSYEPYFSSEFVDDDMATVSRWTKLWKLHGSVNWSTREGAVIRLASGARGEMILPSHRKYEESRKLPYLSLLDRLGRTVGDGGTLLVTCGYSWGDEHINEMIIRALDDHPSSHAIAMMYNNLDDLGHLLALAAQRTNLIVASPREGVIGGRRDVWAVPGRLEPGTTPFMDLVFEADALSTDDGTADSTIDATHGELWLGNFNVFSQFLAALDPVYGSTRGG